MEVHVCNFNELKSLNIDDCDYVNTTSQSKDWSKGLSPFFLGPCKLYGDFVSQNVENAWQHSKVYEEHMDGDAISSRYWEWAEKGWADTWAHRYPMGKGAIPKFSFWNGDRLGYIDARKRIYIPLYRNAVIAVMAWRLLKQKYDAYKKMNRDLYLVDFDAYMHKKIGMSYDNVVNNEKKKMGHAFVLAMALECPEYLDKFE